MGVKRERDAGSFGETYMVFGLEKAGGFGWGLKGRERERENCGYEPAKDGRS